MCDRNVKSEYILIKLRALVFEYICERTTQFHEKIFVHRVLQILFKFGNLFEIRHCIVGPELC